MSLTLKTLVRHMMWVVCDVWEWWSDKKRAKIWTGHIGAQNTDEYFPKLNRQENIQDINELLLVQWKRLNIFMHPLYQQYQNKTSSCWDEEWALDEGFFPWNWFPWIDLNCRKSSEAGEIFTICQNTSNLAFCPLTARRDTLPGSNFNLNVPQNPSQSSI